MALANWRRHAARASGDPALPASLTTLPFGARHAAAFAVLTALAVACSPGQALERSATVEREPTSTITRHITASVLIEPRSDEPAAAIRRISVWPSLVVVDQRETVEMSARALGFDGQLLSDVDFVWTLADPRAGTMSREGVFRAGATPGVFQGAISVTGVQSIYGAVHYVSDRVTVTVVGEDAAPRLTEVAILPANPTVLSGQIFRFWAVGFDRDGLVIPCVKFVWRVNDPSLGRVNDIGYLTVEGDAGTFTDAVTVTGTRDGVSVTMASNVSVIQAPEADGFLNVHVLPQRFYLEPGERLALTAVALNGLGELVTGTELRWSTVKSEAGTIDGYGLFAAGNTPGIYPEAVRVEAIVPGEKGFVRAVDYASVVVRKERSSRRLDAVRVFPESVVMEPAGRAILVAQPLDEFGDPVGNVSISWYATKEGMGEIDDQGILRATGGPGRYPDALRVIAEQQIGDEITVKTGSVDVIITGNLSQLEVQPTLVTIPSGRTVHFGVTGRDENGIVLPGLVARWSVSAVEIGTIDAFGNFTAGEVPGLYQDAIRAEVVQTLPSQR